LAGSRCLAAALVLRVVADLVDALPLPLDVDPDVLAAGPRPGEEITGPPDSASLKKNGHLIAGWPISNEDILMIF